MLLVDNDDDKDYYGDDDFDDDVIGNVVCVDNVVKDGECIIIVDEDYVDDGYFVYGS